MWWVLFAFGSAFFAGITAVLAKCGIKTSDSAVATAIRTCGVLVFAWLSAWVAGRIGTIGTLSARTLVFLALSGLATGASWLCYFRALQIGDVNRVAAVDKSSIILTVILSFAILGETVSPVRLLGLVLIAAGTYLMIERKRTPAASSGGTAPVAFDPPAASVPPVGSVASAASATPAEGTEPAAPEGSAASATPDASAESAASAPGTGRRKTHGWLFFAALSAVFAALTSILGKIGIEGVESNLGTALRTCVVLIMSWIVVAAEGKLRLVRTVPRRELLFILLSSVATGASWLCYYRALQTGPASAVAPIDKLSIIVTVIFSRIVLGERLSKAALLGLIILTAGTLLMLF